MTDKKKMSIQEKEKQILEKIEKERNKLSKLRQKRVLECGDLVIKSNLHEFDNAVLDKEFADIYQKLVNESK